ncbi:hypothetical protein MUO14_16360 [Halobacillus shinanisalinarum]|uniref:Uncharacterized protein n=1 Tax=Halobacillus shinanisalinarum TaxID=2932258 RepID=A0ABY4GVI8_9BACI|nr:hypothetical protein [Halobacillus shinanisalinarum]UOQ92059.1 hypothetical protein MUO14_16360 [Halobacillus shinanisalinarum]
MSTVNRYLSRSLVTESFHDKTVLQEIWGESWGAPTDIGRIKKVMMHRPGKEILKLHNNAQQIESGTVLDRNIKGATPEDYQNTRLPNLDLLQTQHDQLAQVLSNEGIDIVYLEGQSEDWPERIFTRDLGMVIPGGVILSRLALYIRHGEIPFASQTFSQAGIPMLGCIQGDGFAEGAASPC